MAKDKFCVRSEREKELGGILVDTSIVKTLLPSHFLPLLPVSRQ